MGKIKDTLIALGGLGIILAVGLVLILFFGGLSLGVQWLGKLIPFGITGFILGSIIIVITLWFSKQLMPDRKLEFNWDFVNELEFLEIIGYLFGFVIILGSIIWVFLPVSMRNALPSFGNVLAYSFVATLLFYGSAEGLSASILSSRTYLVGCIYYLACGVFGIYFVNMPIWVYTENIPGDYYYLGKAIFAFIFLIEISYIAFFHILPAIQKSKKGATEETKKSE